MRVGLKHKNKKINLDVKKVGGLGKLIGLMFSRRETGALLFDFPKGTRMAIHSWFVFFPFYAIWLDDKMNVLEFKKVKPFSLSVRPEKKYFRLIEIPINEKYRGIITLLLGTSHGS